MNKKEIISEVDSELNSGSTKKETYNKLSKKYDKDSVFRVIAQSAESSDRKRYSSLNKTLVLLLLLLSINWSFILLGFYRSINSSIIGISIAFPLLHLYFAYQIYKFRGWLYIYLSLIEISMLLISMSDLLLFLESNNMNPLLAFLYLFQALLVAAISFVSWLLKVRLFPNLSFLGPKKDSKGKFISL